MNIYRYTIVDTGEVFEGTREQACKHFECTIGKLEGMSRRKELLREVIGKTAYKRRKQTLDEYRFEYDGKVFEGTNQEAMVHFGLRSGHFDKLRKQGFLKREWIGKKTKVVVDDDEKSDPMTREQKRLKWLRRAQLLDMGLLND
ncbi:hypothetical protein [Streptococcus hyointestinalis]|nr:hypothetical protein [Streptococcus hyointestinalis]MCI6871595.1 hypothetical protein [Streptococcus hyointestinalis]